MATIDFIKNLAVGDNIKAQDEINSVLSQMALDAVSSLKQEVAQNYFSGVQEESEQLEEKSGYSAKSAAAGKDIGKKGKNFTKIAKKAAEEYGSEESGKKVAGAILKKLRKEDVETLDEENTSKVYHQTYTSAIQHALDHAKKSGYDVPEDEVWNNISTGPGKPGPGKTTQHHLQLTKDGKPQKKQLHIQVYNRETDTHPYELNHYIN